MNTSNSILSFDKVSFAYEPHAPVVLRNISFSLKPHSITAIVGPSGGGKSTILRLITGLEKPTQGTVELTAKTRMIFQAAALLPWLTVRENVLMGLAGSKLSHRAKEKRMHGELVNLGLTDFAHAYPRDLSGGQRQRVGIARALVSDPELLLLDEPFSALDVETTSRLSEELLQIFSARDVTMLMVSHSIEDAVLLADEVFVFSGGVIAHHVPVSLPRPRHREDQTVQHLVSEIKHFIPSQ